MNNLDLPVDIQKSPFKMKEFFIEAYNRALFKGNKNPENYARKMLVKRFSSNEGSLSSSRLAEIGAGFLALLGIELHGGEVHKNGTTQEVHGGGDGGSNNNNIKSEITTANGNIIFEYDNQNTIEETQDRFIKALSRIPKKELLKSALKKVVSFDNPEDVYRAAEALGIDLSEVELGEQIHGFYYPETQTAYVAAWDSRLGRNSTNTLYHEFAHSVVGLDEGMATSYAESLGFMEEE